MARRLFCAFLAGGATCLLLAVFLWIGPGKAEILEAEKPDLVYATSAITVNEPTLSPAYNGLCNSYWYSMTTNLGSRAYLTLNAFDIKASANSGEWRPNLPQDGYYLVEAYIPSHGSIDWSCPNFSTTVTTDTTSAHYVIYSGTNTYTVTADQSSVHNSWKSLGRFSFKAGTGGSVTLNDITGEPNYQHTVSFSAMRFTYLGSVLPIYLPFVGVDTAKAVHLESVSALDYTGRVRNAFTPQETVYWTANVVNHYGSPSQATYTRTLESPCASPLVSTGNIKLPEGSWSHVFTATVDTCTGLYNYTYQINHQGYVTTYNARYSVNMPGFDICSIPTIDQMKTWWDRSPYYTMNLYTGGISLSGCAKVHPNADWVRQASQQGWTFVPTWVGLQAPCSTFLHPMKWDPNDARQQGIDEANQAAAASRQLGFNNNHTIYFDLEYFASSNQACYAAVRAFLQGWVDQMHNLNLTPGVYGIASDFNRWSSLTPPPDRVWLAAWITPYSYDANVSPWIPGYLSNNLWSNHQRLRQYNGDHSESWGGVQLGIDSDVVDTNLVSTAASNEAVIEAGQGNNPVGMDDDQTIQAIQQTSIGQGWALKAGKLYWTDDNAESWLMLNNPDQGPIIAADFVSDVQGWAASRNLKTGAVEIYHTEDRGESWTAAGPDLSPDDPPVGSASLSFLDPQTGWAAYTYQTSSAFSLGSLYFTQDGGLTWSRESLPIGGKIQFTNQLEGWLQGGSSGREFFRTMDGGQTWQLISEGDPSEKTAELAFAGFSDQRLQAQSLRMDQTLSRLPVGTLQASFSDTQSGWALVQEGSCNGIKLKPGDSVPSAGQPFNCSPNQRILQTKDGGQSWLEISSLDDLRN